MTEQNKVPDEVVEAFLKVHPEYEEDLTGEYTDHYASEANKDLQLFYQGWAMGSLHTVNQIRTPGGD